MGKVVCDQRETLRGILPQDATGPAFVHSDVLRASVFVRPTASRNETLRAHVRFLEDVVQGHDLWLPTFNYKFTKTGLFDVANSPVEVGPLPEFFRTNVAEWRTPDPIFSTGGTGPVPGSARPAASMEAFDNRSMFAQLVRQNGFLLFYGAPFASATIIHHVEYLASCGYRYNKVFRGTVVSNGDRTAVQYTYRVRPLDYHFDYAWDRLLTDLHRDGVTVSTANKSATAIRAATLVEYWLSRLNEDPYYLLDEASKRWIIPKLNELGRPFALADFE